METPVLPVLHPRSPRSTQIVPQNPKRISFGKQHSCFIDDSGAAWLCGGNQHGQLGLGHKNLLTLFQKIDIPNSRALSVSCGGNHTAILCQDGSVWMCGDNEYGQLGLGHKSVSDLVSFQKLVGIPSLITISSGGYHTAGVSQDGSVWMCGLNKDGQLGLGHKNNFDAFQKVHVGTISSPLAISCGGLHTALLAQDGSVLVCGDNKYGQLGLGHNNTVDSFQKVPLVSPSLTISSGSYHTAIVSQDGSLWMCGRNDEGQLGLGHQNNMNTFQKVGSIASVQAVSCGYFNTAIISKDTSVWICRRNENGQLGLQHKNNTNTFQKIEGIPSTLGVVCEAFNTAVIFQDGTIWMCGRNNCGQFGLGHKNDIMLQKTPITMTPPTHVSSPDPILIPFDIDFRESGFQDFEFGQTGIKCHKAFLAVRYPKAIDPSLDFSSFPKVVVSLFCEFIYTNKIPINSLPPDILCSLLKLSKLVGATDLETLSQHSFQEALTINNAYDFVIHAAQNSLNTEIVCTQTRLKVLLKDWNSEKWVAFNWS